MTSNGTMHGDATARKRVLSPEDFRLEDFKQRRAQDILACKTLRDKQRFADGGWEAIFYDQIHYVSQSRGMPGPNRQPTATDYEPFEKMAKLSDPVAIDAEARDVIRSIGPIQMAPRLVVDNDKSEREPNGDHERHRREPPLFQHAPPQRQTSEEFIADFIAPDYLLDGVLQRRFLYAFTGRTGSGKTAVALLLAACVGEGKAIGAHEVTRGPVFYLCGENADDVRMRWIAMAQQMDFDPATVDVHFFTSRFSITDAHAHLKSEAEEVGDVALVIVDTSAAYFPGNDPNNNAQQGQHARALRELVGLPGGPCVVALCHPVKNAAADNLVPYGGGAFLNEVDGNLTCAIEDSAIEVHWQGKFRGPDFAPIAFKVRSVTHERLKTSRDRLMPTVIAEHLSEVAREEIAKAVRSHEDQLLAELARNGGASLADLAKACGWFFRSGEPDRSRVTRTLRKLKAQKLITTDERDGVVLTDKGRKIVEANGGPNATLL